MFAVQFIFKLHDLDYSLEKGKYRVLSSDEYLDRIYTSIAHLIINLLQCN